MNAYKSNVPALNFVGASIPKRKFSKWTILTAVVVALFIVVSSVAFFVIKQAKVDETVVTDPPNATERVTPSTLLTTIRPVTPPVRQSTTSWPTEPELTTEPTGTPEPKTTQTEPDTAPTEMTTDWTTSSPEPDEAPLSPRVLSVLEEFAANINSSVDPCDDFYEYACGSFRRKYPIPDGRSQVDYYTLYADRVHRTIVDRLEGDELLADTTAKPLKYLKRVWQSCVHEISMYDQLPELYKYLEEIDQLGSWVAKFEKLSSNGFNVILTIGMDSDPIWTAPTISIGSPELEFADAYSSEGPVLDALRDYYVRLIGLYYEDMNREDRLNLAREIIEFESWMFTNSTPASQKVNNFNRKRVTTRGANGYTSPHLVWDEVLKSFIKSDSDFSFVPLMINDVKYMDNFKKLITSKDDKFYSEYFKLAVTHQLCFFLGSRCRSFYIDMAQAMGKFEDRRQFRKDKCYKTLETTLEGAMFKTFDKEFALIKRNFIDTLNSNLTVEMRNLVESFSWIDEKSMEKVSRRLSQVNRNTMIKHKYDFVSERSFERHFETVPFIDAESEKIDLFTHFKGLIEWNKRKDFAMYGKNRAIWPISLFATHPSWMDEEGLYFLPAYLVDDRLFDSELPEQIQFGMLGTLLAHGATRSFDRRADQWQRHWEERFWTNETRDAFSDRMQCVVDIYDGQEVEIDGESSGLKIDGSSTLDENLADMIGLHVAYEAFKNDTWDHQPSWSSSPANVTKFPHPLRDMVDDRLFFLSYANVHCSNDAKHVPHVIEKGFKSPRKYRVNLPLSQNKKFAEAFQCREGSKMNPAQRCVLNS